MAEPSNDVRTLARPVDERKEGVAFHEQTRRTRTAEPLASLCDCGIGPVPRQHRIRTLYRLVGVRHAHAGEALAFIMLALAAALALGVAVAAGSKARLSFERVASGRAGARADRRAGCTGPTGVRRRRIFRAGYGSLPSACRRQGCCSSCMRNSSWKWASGKPSARSPWPLPLPAPCRSRAPWRPRVWRWERRSSSCREPARSWRWATACAALPRPRPSKRT